MTWIIRMVGKKKKNNKADRGGGDGTAHAVSYNW